MGGPLSPLEGESNIERGAALGGSSVRRRFGVEQGPNVGAKDAGVWWGGRCPPLRGSGYFLLTTDD